MNRVGASSIILMGVAVLSLAPLSSYSQSCGPVVRAIDDRATGNRWLLMRDAGNSGGPGRMVRVESVASWDEIHPVIHAGDALVVEEHSAVVDARLEATALGSATVGSEFEARLTIGGKVVRVLALGQGRTALAPQAKAKR